MYNKELQPTFWITNITTRDVSLSDLGVVVKQYSSVNLLDARHYHLTVEQIEKSLKNGSLYKRSNIIKVRVVPPEEIKLPQKQVYDGVQTQRIHRPIIKVEPPKYEELDFTDEKYAEEDLNAAIEDMDPGILKRK